MLDKNTVASLLQYLDLLENDIIFSVSLDKNNHGQLKESSQQMWEFLEEIVSLSTRLKLQEEKLTRTPSFEINQVNKKSGVTFAGIPMGHEFTSFIMALLQVSGRKPKIEDSQITQIKSLEGRFHFESYVSLTCHNCPDVVQALNILSVLNEKISHTMIEGGTFQKEVEEKNIMAVPSIFLNGQHFGNGRMTLEEILAKIDKKTEDRKIQELNDKGVFDTLIVGGGPAGSSAAIYLARKGLKTGLIAERFGGQVMDTLGIENFISNKATQGPQLVQQLEEHVKDYDVDVMTLQKAKKLSKKEYLEIELESGAQLKAKSVIVATGARWRELNIPGEKEFKNKGVAYCPHCDGPLFKGKNVAVVGGGNSGVEAAIDLAGIVNHVTLLEYGNKLKADSVLQKRLEKLNNVTVLTQAQTTQIIGDEKVTALNYKSTSTGQIHTVSLEGVFVQIGLVPNTHWLKESVEQTPYGEIVIDKHGHTSMSGVFAAGDCTNIPFKQIIIAMGEGAKAGLGAFDYLIRN